MKICRKSSGISLTATSKHQDNRRERKPCPLRQYTDSLVPDFFNLHVILLVTSALTSQVYLPVHGPAVWGADHSPQTLWVRQILELTQSGSIERPLQTISRFALMWGTFWRFAVLCRMRSVIGLGVGAGAYALAKLAVSDIATSEYS